MSQAAFFRERQDNRFGVSAGRVSRCCWAARGAAEEEEILFFLSDLSHFNWVVWRISGHILYWLAAFVLVFVGVFRVEAALASGRILDNAVRVLLPLAFLFGAYWLRRWLTSVVSIWPWMTLAREIEKRRRQEAPRPLDAS